MGNILGSVATGLAQAGAGALGSKLFGSSGSKIEFQPPSISAGGFTGSGGSITPTAERMRMVDELAATFGPQADAYADLRSKVTPGFSAFRDARLAEVEGARTRAVGNLRDNLARRRVLGSSFGSDALVRAESEFSREKERVQAESFLSELEASNALIGKEFEARRGGYQTFLDELNLEAQVATSLSTNASQVLASNAQLKARLDAQNAAGGGRFFGQVFQPVATQIGNSVQRFFTPSANPGSNSDVAYA